LSTSGANCSKACVTLAVEMNPLRSGSNFWHTESNYQATTSETSRVIFRIASKKKQKMAHGS
jgi:hypothetical protein